MNATVTSSRAASHALHRVIATFVVMVAAVLGFSGTAQARPEPGPTPGVVPVSYPDITKGAAEGGSGWAQPTVLAVALVLAIAVFVVGVAVIAQRTARHRRQVQAAG